MSVEHDTKVNDSRNASNDELWDAHADKIIADIADDVSYCHTVKIQGKTLVPHDFLELLWDQGRIDYDDLAAYLVGSESMDETQSKIRKLVAEEVTDYLNNDGAEYVMDEILEMDAENG